MNPQLAQTPLHPWHVAHKARMVDFAGWSMPVIYTSIVAEHTATRQAVGLFDISHMGRLRIDGPDALKFLDRMVTRRVTDLARSKIRYALVTNEHGGILDDVLVYHLQDGHFQLVVNASNRHKIVDWLGAHRDGHRVEIVDRTTDTAMIAVQGPKAIGLISPMVDVDLPGMKYYTAADTTIAGAPGLVSRTGYTGEDGCELIVPAEAALDVWQTVFERGQSVGLLPAGLGCRDTLRLEAAMPLYGHELSEQINPVQAGLDFALTLQDRQFIGRDAMVRFQQDPAQPRRIGLELTGRRVPRQGHPILAGETAVGEVTSGTFSPTLERPIAMGYVRPESAAGVKLAVDIRGHVEPAVVVSLPFYQRPG